MGAPANQPQQQQRGPMQPGQMGPPPPQQAPAQQQGGSYFKDNRKGQFGQSLMMMGLNMLAQGPSENPTSFGSMLGQGALAGADTYGKLVARKKREDEEERIRKRQEILDARARTNHLNALQDRKREIKRQGEQDARAVVTFNNSLADRLRNQGREDTADSRVLEQHQMTLMNFLNSQSDRKTAEQRREASDKLIKDIDLSALPAELSGVVRVGLASDNPNQAIQTLSTYLAQKQKGDIEQEALTASGNMFAGDPQMDNAGLQAQAEFTAQHGRPPNMQIPSEAQMVQSMQMNAYDALKSQSRPQPTFEREEDKKLAERNDTVMTELETKRKTNNKVRNHNQIAMRAVESGMETGPLASAAHNIYNTAENFAALVGLGDEHMGKLQEMGDEVGIRQGANDLFQQSFDRAAIDVTGDMSGQISNYELQLAGGTNVSPENRPAAIRMVVAYKELQYQHDEQREQAFYDAMDSWDPAEHNGKQFNGSKFLRQWDKENKLEVEERDSSGKLTGVLTPYGQQLEAIGLIRPKGNQPTTDLPDGYVVIGGP